MCGIVGYVGERECVPILLAGLRELEYRGSDSAGLAVLNGKLQIHKSAGTVTKLEATLPSDLGGSIGIGHTRWATHGEPNVLNAHPHFDPMRRVALVHNGMLE